MKIIKFTDLVGVKCPKNDFVSYRYLLEKDNFGFTVTQTFIKKTERTGIWHYKNHLEACLCIGGGGYVVEEETGFSHRIDEGTMYALNNHDRHYFIATEDTVLVCVFNPPLTGKEIHKKDGSYERNADVRF